MTEFGQGHEFLCRDSVWSRPGVSMLRHSIFFVATEFGLGSGFYVATEYSYVTIEFSLDMGF